MPGPIPCGVASRDDRSGRFDSTRFRTAGAPGTRAEHLYAAIARRRRERYAARPDLRRRLRPPVISIGNLAVGGRGKTPLVATIAGMLLEMGEKPAILSRGYGRARTDEGRRRRPRRAARSAPASSRRATSR